MPRIKDENGDPIDYWATDEPGDRDGYHTVYAQIDGQLHQVTLGEPHFQVRNLDAPNEVGAGEAFYTDAVIDNSDGREMQQTIEYHIDGSLEDTWTVTLEENTTNLSFGAYAPDNTGTYSVSVHSDDTYASTIIDVINDLPIIEDFERSSLGNYYWIDDTGQSELPDTSTSASYRGDYGYDHPYGNPNTVVSLSSNNPAYDSTVQPDTHDAYPGPNKVLEFYFKPVTFGDGSFARFMINSEQYYRGSCLRLPIDPDGYWRIETVDSNGSWDYYGTDPQSEYFNLVEGDWHRIVFDQTSWPDVSAHLWNDATGNHLSSLETSGGDGQWSEEGFGIWVNDQARIYADYFNEISTDSYTANADM